MALYQHRRRQIQWMGTNGASTLVTVTTRDFANGAAAIHLATVRHISIHMLDTYKNGYWVAPRNYAETLVFRIARHGLVQRVRHGQHLIVLRIRLQRATRRRNNLDYTKRVF